MKDLTVGNEGKLIFFFALPMLLGNFLQQFYTLADGAIVGKFIGKEALAAVGASFPIIFTMIALLIGISSGGMVVISQYFGAKDMDKVKKTIETMYIFMFISSIILTIAGLLLIDPLFRLMKLPAELFPQAKTYLSIFISGLTLFFAYNGTAAILRGMGDSKTPLYFLIFSTFSNIMLDLLFVVVFKWGIAGAAFASVISQAMAVAGIMIYLHKNHPVISFNFRQWVFDRELFRKSFSIGLPTGLQHTFVSLGMMALFGIVNSFGTDVVAAFTAAGRIDSLATDSAIVFAQALATFVGQNIGAGKPERVRRGLMVTLFMSWTIAGIMTVFIIIFRSGIMLWFVNADEVEVIQIGSKYLAIITSFYLVFTTMFAFNGLMRGAGDTLIPMFITLLGLWLFRIPVAYFLSKHIGETGIWWSIPIGWSAGAIMSILYYKTGRWKKKAVVTSTAEKL